tara:strand:- start:1114 stop:1398 length:285 start_codon:yes stop_codon:yes gene_type:complete
MIKIIKKSIKKTLFKGDLIYLALAVYLGSVMERFLFSVSKDCVQPFISLIFPIEIIHTKFSLLGLDISDVITQGISLSIALTLSYIILNLAEKL